MKSTLFLANLSIIDYGILDENGVLRGGSYNPSFLVTGEVDEVEQVVVDFSTIKKDIKSIIDDRVSGFDHKLILLEKNRGSLISMQIDDSRFKLKTKALSLDVPVYAVKVLGPSVGSSVDDIGKAIEDYVTFKLQAMYPKINISVQCFNNIEQHTICSTVKSTLFRYNHGLKSSTAWGCQNIAHGHLSYIQLFHRSVHSHIYEYHPGEEDIEDAIDALRISIASDLDNTIFVFNENVSGIKRDSSENATTIEIAYESRDRGNFYQELNLAYHKVVVLQTETTVENLIQYVADRYKEELKAAHVTSIALSEGLSKGAYLNLV